MKSLVFAVVAMMTVEGSSLAAQKPSKESLVSAWEAALKADPDTKVFEKINDGRYKFKTEAFPYDGELVVLNAVVSEGFEGPFSGKIELDLPGMTQDLKNKLSGSYSSWDWRHNHFGFSEEEAKWLTWREQGKIADAKRKRSLTRRIGDSLPYVFGALLLGYMVFMVWVIREAIKSTKETAKLRESLSCTNKKLARLLERLESRDEAGDK